MLTTPVAIFSHPLFAVGLLPFRGSVMLDFVTIAMFVVLVVMAVSIWLVKARRAYQLHSILQIALGIILLVAVTAFEIDLRFITKDWTKLAEPSPYYTPAGWNAVWISLTIHLCFAIPTPFLWAFVIVRAIWKFPRPITPGVHSREHKNWAWAATVGMVMTAVTGWVFYYLAFVAS